MKNKESAYVEFYDMIIKSWTWAKLTEDEKAACNNAFHFVLSQGVLKGTYQQRYMILHSVYNAFLDGCGFYRDGI